MNHKGYTLRPLLVRGFILRWLGSSFALSRSDVTRQFELSDRTKWTIWARRGCTVQVRGLVFGFYIDRRQLVCEGPRLVKTTNGYQTPSETESLTQNPAN